MRMRAVGAECLEMESIQRIVDHGKENIKN